MIELEALSVATSWWLGLDRGAFGLAQKAEEARMRLELLPAPVQAILDATLELEAKELLGKETRRTRVRVKRLRGEHE
jgi:hypothetical protein